MKPTKFPQMSMTAGLGQTQYEPVPLNARMLLQGRFDEENNALIPDVFEFTARYDLSPLEIAQIIRTGAIYIRQHGPNFQPLLPSVEMPLHYIDVEYEEVRDNVFNLQVVMNDHSLLELKEVSIFEVMGKLLEKLQNANPDNIRFIEWQQPAVDDGGKIVPLFKS